MLSDITNGLLKLDPPVDAVVLPGGYFVQGGKSDRYLDLAFEDRGKLLCGATFAEAAAGAAQALDERRTGALLILGVDTVGPKNPLGDQLCVAWSATGPTGVARKVFPTREEGKNGYIVNANDFGAKERVVSLGGTRVLLCSCYDGYGITNQPDKSKYVSRLSADGTVARRGDPEFRRLLNAGLQEWRGLVQTVDSAVVAIHYFGRAAKRDGFSTSYWRRHGLATASATLQGGWVVAGANFDGRLPCRGTDILAAHRVPLEHLSRGHRRETYDATPVCDYMEGDDEVRVRLFDFYDDRMVHDDSELSAAGVR